MDFSELGTFKPSNDLWVRLSRNYARLEEGKYQPENLYQKEKGARKWPGDTEGRTLLAWTLLSQAMHRESRYLDNVLKMWPAECNERGYIGHIYEDGISEQQLSSHGWVLRALAEIESIYPKGPARKFAQPIIENLFLKTLGMYTDYPIDPQSREHGGEYSGTHLKQVGNWILSTDVGAFAIGMSGVIDAYETFGDQRLEPLIEEMIDLFLRIDLPAIQAQTHATLTGLRGILKWARLKKRRELIDEAKDRYRLYKNLAMTETYANYNWFGRPQWTEPCAIVDSLMVAMELWRVSRDTQYLSDAQMIYFNALGHGQRSNGGFGCDNCPGADGETELFFSTSESHWCCTMRGSEGLARMSQYLVVHDENTILLPFGLPGDYAAGEHVFTIESGYPETAWWKIENHGKETLKCALFIPEWIEVAHEPSAGQWLHIEVAAGDAYELQGKMVEGQRPVLEATSRFNPDTKNLHVKFRGPLILARYEDEWKPVAYDYRRNNMDIDASRKLLLT